MTARRPRQTNPPPPPAWLDEQLPHEPRRSRAQVRGLLDLLGRPSRKVLDLGCGSGRVLVPLAKAGHRVVGIDRDPAALRTSGQAIEKANASAALVEGDFTDARALRNLGADQRSPRSAARFDAVLCLGNTLMTLTDVDRAVELLTRIRALLSPRGAFVIDDIPADLWPELTEGNWLSGISQDGRAQLVWSRTDAVFTLRQGRSINQRKWTLSPTDRPLRLWTDGCLQLLARASGLSPPVRYEASGLLIMGRGPASPAAHQALA
jgi:SAM-dependent methyltransferase